MIVMFGNKRGMKINFAVSINLSAKTLLANAIIPLLDEIIAF